MADTLKEVTEEVKEKTVSYSQYSVWAVCPLKWKLEYVDKMRIREQTIHLLFGTAMHEVIQSWYKYAIQHSFHKAKRLDLDTQLLDVMKRLFKESTVDGGDGVLIFPSDKDTMKEFYQDGIYILDHLREYGDKFFDFKDTELLGIEFPLKFSIKGELNYIGFLDIVTKSSDGTIKILDIKTSKSGWNKWAKADTQKLTQLLLYKRFYSNICKVPEEDIVVEFVIVKRKLWEASQYPQKRLSKFEPANGRSKVKAAIESFNTFVDTCFDDNGNYITNHIQPTPSASNCRFCQFNSKKDICSVGIEPQTKS